LDSSRHSEHRKLWSRRRVIGAGVGLGAGIGLGAGLAGLAGQAFQQGQQSQPGQSTQAMSAGGPLTRQQIQEAIDGLDLRFSKGEIGEDNYNRLMQKWETKLKELDG